MTLDSMGFIMVTPKVQVDLHPLVQALSTEHLLCSNFLGVREYVYFRHETQGTENDRQENRDEGE